MYYMKDTILHIDRDLIIFHNNLFSSFIEHLGEEYTAASTFMIYNGCEI